LFPALADNKMRDVAKLLRAYKPAANDLVPAVSRYSKNNLHEFLAETFTATVLNKTNGDAQSLRVARTLWQILGKLLERPSINIDKMLETLREVVNTSVPANDDEIKQQRIAANVAVLAGEHIKLETYGWWITEKGVLKQVGYEQHVKVAKEILENQGISFNNADYQTINDTAFDLGWLRLTQSGIGEFKEKCMYIQFGEFISGKTYGALSKLLLKSEYSWDKYYVESRVFSYKTFDNTKAVLNTIRKYVKYEISSSAKPKDRVLALIKAAEKKFGFDSLSGGNCGTFAIALGKIMIESGQDCDLFLMIGNVDLDEKPTQEQLEQGEYDFEHVLLHTKFNGRDIFYDVTGRIPFSKIQKYCLDFHEKNYSGYLSEGWLEVDEAGERIIRQNTDWSISVSTFYNFLKSIFPVNGNKVKANFTVLAALSTSDLMRGGCFAKRLSCRFMVCLLVMIYTMPLSMTKKMTRLMTQGVLFLKLVSVRIKVVNALAVFLNLLTHLLLKRAQNKLEIIL